MSFDSSFIPAWWCRNPHLQTLWPYFFRLKPKPEYRRERLELPDGDFVDLDWIDGRNHSPIVVMFHGLAGSSNSHYVRGLTAYLSQRGFSCVVAHHRGCSGEPNRHPGSYHAGFTLDIDTVLLNLRRRQTGTPLYCVGYSLGGNMLLRWLHDNRGNQILSAAVVISAPLLLADSMNRIQHGLSRIYQRRLVSLLKKSLTEKFSRMPCPVDLGEASAADSFWDFDNRVTAPLHGFKDVHDYYHQCSGRQYLSNIDTPTLLIHAADDPLVPKSAVPTKSELSSSVDFELSRHGGHCGFVGGWFPGIANYWTENRIYDYFSGHRLNDGPG